MKKLLAITALLGAISYSFGQGQVNFNNSSATLISTNTSSVGGTNGPTSPSLGGFVYALFIAPTNQTTTDQNQSGFTFTGFYGTNTATTTGGRFNGGQPSLAGHPAGETANILILGWSANIGSDLNAVHLWWNNGSPSTSGYYGQSQIAVNQILGGGGGPLPIPSPMGVGPGQSPGFFLNIYPIPEPATFALAGLGAAALLIFRRRK